MEIDGFDTHVTKMDRDKLADEHDRQNGMTYHRFSIVRFTYDQLTQKPAACAKFLKLLLDKLERESAWMNQLSARERLVFQYALKCGNGHLAYTMLRRRLGWVRSRYVIYFATWSKLVG